MKSLKESILDPQDKVLKNVHNIGKLSLLNKKLKQGWEETPIGKDMVGADVNVGDCVYLMDDNRMYVGYVKEIKYWKNIPNKYGWYIIEAPGTTFDDIEIGPWRVIKINDINKI